MRRAKPATRTLPARSETPSTRGRISPGNREVQCLPWRTKVRHTVLEEPDHPFVLQRVEEDPNVRIDHQFTFFVMMLTVNASSARCGLRFRRNPYENPRESVS